MDVPSPRYQEVARFVRAYAAGRGKPLDAQPATIAEIEAAERALGARLPDGYRWFQLEFGDFNDGPLDIFSVRRPDQCSQNIVEVNHKERSELRPRLPVHLIAFSNNGGGDLLCFDTMRQASGDHPVVWWDHEQDEDQEPAEAAPSFLDWLEAELRERAAEERGSLLDAFPYKDWIATWLHRRSE